MKINEIIHIIEHDSWMMDVLLAAETLKLHDWMIGAGFVRNKIWDHIHAYRRPQVHTSDIDLIYYDTQNLSEEREKEYDAVLRKLMPLNWSAKNQARMHNMNGHPPYENTEHALSNWVETCTCIAVTLDENKVLKLIAPYGIDDLVNLIVRPTPGFINNVDVLLERVGQKGWLKEWPRLKVIID